MYSAVIFDFDGTICDTKEGIVNGASYALRAMGEPEATREELLRFVGPSLWYSFGTFYAYDKEKQDLAVEKYREYYNRIGIYEAELYGGIIHLLKELKKNGIKTAIASAKYQGSVETALKHMNAYEYFDAIFGSFKNGDRSDKSELADAALKQLNEMPGKNAALVGDSKTDAIGAFELNLDFIAACYDRGKEEFDGLNVDKFAFSVKELQSMLLK